MTIKSLDQDNHEHKWIETKVATLGTTVIKICEKCSVLITLNE